MSTLQNDWLAEGAVAFQPLASRMRPVTLDQYVGQQSVIGVDSPLRAAVLSGCVPSLVFWGPPGVGKTTLAKVIARYCQGDFISLSAVEAGVKDIKQVVEKATLAQHASRTTVLFIDEIHRFNKAQQDALLPHVESGLFILMGATTENPSFELNNALLSRLSIYKLAPLDTDDILSIVNRAIDDREKGVFSLPASEDTSSDINLIVNDDARGAISKHAQGDARHALSLLELAVNVAQAQNLEVIDEALIARVLTERGVQFDKGGDHFYDQISALHKSVRGSSPDAALYWMARMLLGGCDPLYIARRVVRMATEDIGNADPRALSVALSAWDVQTRLGMPEGELALAQAVVYLSVAPKSNATYTALKAAMTAAKKFSAEPVPLHLRNAPTALMKSLDYGKEYQYAHDYPNAFAAGECYLPESLSRQSFYQPTNQGLEAKIQSKLSAWGKLNADSEFQRY